MSRGCSGSAARPLLDLGHRLLEPALVGEDPRLVEGHEDDVLRIDRQQAVVEAQGPLVEPVQAVDHGGHEEHGRVVRGLLQQLLHPGVGLVLVPVVHVHVDHLQARVHEGGVDGEGVLERALGQHEVLGTAPALRVEHVAPAEGGVGPRELRVEADRLVHHLDRLVEVDLVVGAQEVAEEGVAAAQVELVGLRAVGERPVDLLLLLRGQAEPEPGQEPLRDLVLDVEEVAGQEVDLVAPEDVAGRRLEELGGDPHPLRGPDEAAAEHEARREILADLLGIDALPDVRRDVGRGAHHERLDVGELGDDAVGQRELVEGGVGVPGEVAEGEDGEGGTLLAAPGGRAGGRDPGRRSARSGAPSRAPPPAAAGPARGRACRRATRRRGPAAARGGSPSPPSARHRSRG